MRQLSFLSGAAVALTLASTAGTTVLVFAPAVGMSSLLKLLASILGFLYLVWLIRGSRRRSGHFVALTFWVALSVGTWFFVPTLSMYLLVHIAAIWLIRSLQVYARLLPALLDLGLTAVSAAAASLAFSRSGSAFLATWSFFLLQALFVAIPVRISPKSGSNDPDDEVDGEAFESARRRGDAALEQLFTR